MSGELAMAVATALATKGAEAAMVGGKNALTGLLDLVRDRFGRETHAAAVLDRAVDDPDDLAKRVRLAGVLADVMTRDHAFADRVRAHWAGLSGEVTADHGAVVNHFSGRAEKVVQVRDVRGDINM
jgi:hypothetical protein